jgi:uncharacterized protein
MLFINRDRELDFLNRKWEEGVHQLIVLYGKRRVGKTELMKHFLQEKPGIYFLADKRDVATQVKELLNIVGLQLDNPLLANYPVTDWIGLFQLLKEHITETFVIVIDEYPYLTEADSTTSSVFQKIVDEILKNSHIFLVLSGSSIAMMENEVLNYTSPLYGRRTGDILLQPLSFQSSRKFYPTLDFDQFLEYYMVLGNLPAYISRFDPKKTVLQNIETTILHQGELFNEINFILRQEFREPTNYFAILKAVSGGQRKFSEIVNSTPLASNLLTTYLQTLENLYLIKKEYSVTDNPSKSKKGLYMLTDNFYIFWFRYVYPFKSYLEIGQTSASLFKIQQDWSTQLGKVYEQVAQELMWELSAQYPEMFFTMEQCGRWWNTNTEIDIVGYSLQLKQMIFGEVKYTAKPVGINIYEQLKEKAKYVPLMKEERRKLYILFSGGGFTDELKKLAQADNSLFLIEKDQLVL